MTMYLEMKHITKKYGELLANDDISLSLDKGEVLAILGENGAGKTTIMKILYGLEEPTSGDIYLNNTLKHFKTPRHAIECGIGMVQQHFMLFEPFTVAENIVYSKEPTKGIFMDMDRARNIVTDLSKKYELQLHPDLKIEDMPVGLRQRVEILKVLYQNADIIIFDEPTAVLTPQEVTDLLKTIRSLANLGKSIIIITHKLAEVMEVADRALVMRSGKYIAERKISDTSIEELSYLMIGKKISQKAIETTDYHENILRVENLVVEDKMKTQVVKDCSIHVNRGEIVGIAGVSGNGQSELEQAIFGLMPIAGGKITLQGTDITGKNVLDVRKAGVAMIPEDRYKWGSALQATIMETSWMGHHKSVEFSKNGVLNVKKAKSFTDKLVRDYFVKVESVSDKTASLSGGNAQKLIVGREMMQNTPLLIACEPTRGVDIGAMEYIHDRLLQKRREGDGVLLISSELTEIMKLSDRIYVMYGGKIAGELRRGEAGEKEIGLLMAGGKKNE